MMEERLRRIYGIHFKDANEESLRVRFACERLMHTINNSEPQDVEIREEAFRELFGSVGRNVYIQPPFYCDFGKNIFIGDGCYFNFNCTILDTDRVQIGERCWIAPNVQIYAATHPVDAEERRTRCIAKPVTIGNDVWLGGSVIVCPGVTIGDRSVIGAGSIVTRDIPADCVAYGNPCRVRRMLMERHK